ncbi:hypothetical protein BKA62DRAFT_381273 [Auriculariales sp. MPI-PUGE-AT-0066]|nr:hypothetical protein BKA62DRAFT_381273 [Auriculariales sp. MPI-PUGE-AT-0066]
MDSDTSGPFSARAARIEWSSDDRDAATPTAEAIGGFNEDFASGCEDGTLADYDEEMEVVAICTADDNDGKLAHIILVPPQRQVQHCHRLRRLLMFICTTLLAFIVCIGPSSRSAPRKMPTTSIVLVGLALPTVHAATTRGTCWENTCVQLQGGKVRLHVDQQLLIPLENNCATPSVKVILEMHAAGVVHKTHASAIYDIFGALRGYTTTYNIVGDGTEVACYDGQLSTGTVLSWCYIAKANDDFGRADAQATACTLEHTNNDRLVRDGFWIVLDIGLPNDLQWKGWYMGIVGFMFAIFGVPPLIEWYRKKYEPFFNRFKKAAASSEPHMDSSPSHVAINVHQSASGSSSAVSAITSTAARHTHSSLANANLDQMTGSYVYTPSANSPPVLPPPSYMASLSTGTPPRYVPQRAQTMPTLPVSRSVPPTRPSRNRRPPPPPPMPSPHAHPWQL